MKKKEENRLENLKDYVRKLLVDNLMGKRVVPLVALGDIPDWPREFNEGIISSVDIYSDRPHLELTFRRSDGSPTGHLCDIFYQDFSKYRVE